MFERNTLYLSRKSFISSDYLLNHLGYDPAKTLRRLGDGAFEMAATAQQAAIWHADTAGYLMRGDQNSFKTLMDNAISFASQTGLKIGTQPSALQLKKLKKDIFWLVEKRVSGKRVLSPVFYAANRDSLAGPSKSARISARDISMDISHSLFNAGDISAIQNLDIDSAFILNYAGDIRSDAYINLQSEDISNISGSIQGALLDISASGSFISRPFTKGLHIQQKDGSEYITYLGAAPLVSSTKGSLGIDAADISLQKSHISSASDISLLARNTLNILDSRYYSSYDFSFKRGYIKGSSWNTAGSEIKAKDSIFLRAKNINIKGSLLQSDSLRIKSSLLNIMPASKSTDERFGAEEKGLFTGYKIDTASYILSHIPSRIITKHDAHIASDSIVLDSGYIKAGSLDMDTSSLGIREQKDITSRYLHTDRKGVMVRTLHEKLSHKETLAPAEISSADITLNTHHLNTDHIDSSSILPFMDDFTFSIKSANTHSYSYEHTQKSLTTFGSLIVQALAATIVPQFPLGTSFVQKSATTAINSICRQLGSSLIGSAITGNALSIDPGSLIRNAAKEAMGMALNMKIDSIDSIRSVPFASEVLRSASLSAIDSALYNEKFSDAFASRLTHYASVDLFKKIGDYSMAHNYEDGSLAKTLMHSAAGGVISAARDGDFASGAAAAALREILSPLSEHSTESMQRFISSMTGMIAGAVVSSDKGARSGYSTALDAEMYNRQITQHGYLAGLTWAQTKNMDLFPVKVCLGQLA
jgi:hypothetical protein